MPGVFAGRVSLILDVRMKCEPTRIACSSFFAAWKRSRVQPPAVNWLRERRESRSQDATDRSGD
jgi:hypothetical protein